MSIEATIRARRAIHLGHRVIAKDEVLARVTFNDRADAGFFVRRLGWSAFAVDLPKEPEAAPAPAAVVPPAAPAAPAATAPDATAPTTSSPAEPPVKPVAPAKPAAPKK